MTVYGGSAVYDEAGKYVPNDIKRTSHCFLKAAWRSWLVLRFGDCFQHVAERFPLHFFYGPADVDGDNILFIGQRSLKGLELAVDHVGTHVMILSLGDTGEKKLLRSVEENEMDLNAVIVVSSNADDIAILALESRASKDDSIGSGIQSLDGFLP